MTLAERRQLLVARELLELRLAGACLRALTTALLLEHPTLAEPHDDADPPSLRRARVLVRRSAALRRDLTRYRRDVLALAPFIETDLPF